eukprot:Hpha_TRINITY_DN12551_c0_g2::TRINITY_DN12551_c0_g2_i1::g.50970::m.50970/K01811/xylS, yicI; alpha-D-xyloside xylohydrolase
MEGVMRVVALLYVVCGTLGAGIEARSVNTVSGTVGGHDIRLEAWGTNSIRVRIAEAGVPITEPIRGALLPMGREVVEGGGTNLTNGNIKVVFDEVTGLPIITRVSDSVTLLKGKEVVFTGSYSTPQVNASNSQSVAFEGYTQKIFGLGEHGITDSSNKLDLFPYKRVFADSLFYGRSHGSDVSIPWYASSAGYGFVWNSPSLGNVSLGTDGLYWGGQDNRKNLDFWVTTLDATPEEVVAATGRSFYEPLLRQYVDAVGHATPIPWWATGFIQSKDRYRNQTQVMEVAREYKRRALPISMLVIDWFHWPQMGDFMFKPECFPDPGAMVEELRGLGIELMVTMWPFMGFEVSKNWQEYLNNGYLANYTTTGEANTTTFWRYNTPTNNALIDFTNPAAMNATFRHWYEGYGKYGIKAIWMDETEPDHQSYIGGGQWNLHAGSDGQVLPAWVSYYIRGMAEGLRSVGLENDFFILARSAWVGTWSDGAALWSGDVASSWDMLHAHVQAGQTAGMSGIPLWTSDIGGYHGGDPDSADFQQMIVRWFQFGAFCPVFRTHGHRSGGPPPNTECWATNGDNEVWNLARDAAHYDALVAVMQLREGLRDYVSRINKESVSTGIPMMRPMFLEFSLDPVCNTNTTFDQYMFGPDWLISPVTAPNATTWQVYLPVLPPKHEWVYWWGNQTDPTPPGWHTVSVAAIADFPLFFRRPVQPIVPVGVVQSVEEGTFAGRRSTV